MAIRVPRNDLKLLLMLVLSNFITYFGVCPQTLELIQMQMREFMRGNLVSIQWLVVAGAARAVYIIMIWRIVVHCPEVAISDPMIAQSKHT